MTRTRPEFEMVVNYFATAPADSVDLAFRTVCALIVERRIFPAQMIQPLVEEVFGLTPEEEARLQTLLAENAEQDD